jgi:hypothetical protein
MGNRSGGRKPEGRPVKRQATRERQPIRGQETRATNSQGAGNQREATNQGTGNHGGKGQRIMGQAIVWETIRRLEN